MCRHKRKRIFILLAVALVVAGAIAAGVVIPLSIQPKPPPMVPPNLASLLSSVSEKGLNDMDSPQFKALNWIANKDPANTLFGIIANETIKQRYVAALLYFALNGENWIDKFNFLKGNPICSWNQKLMNILCNSAKVGVMALNICKSNRLSSITISPNNECPHN